MDAGALRYCGVRYRCKSVAATPNSIVLGTGDHPAWSSVLLSLAQARYTCFLNGTWRRPRGCILALHPNALNHRLLDYRGSRVEALPKRHRGLVRPGRALEAAFIDTDLACARPYIPGRVSV